MGKHLGERAEELAGLVLVVFAALAALGLYGDLAGPFGRGVATAGTALMGPAAHVLPPVLAVVGIALLFGVPDDEPLPVAVGAAFAVVGSLGILHVVRTGAEMGVGFGDIGALRDLAGVGGAVVGEPLQAGLGEWGSGVVLGAGALFGLLLALKLSLREVAHGVAVAARWLGRQVRGLGELPADAEIIDDGDTGEPAPSRAVVDAAEAEADPSPSDAEVPPEEPEHGPEPEEVPAEERIEVHVPSEVPDGEQLEMLPRPVEQTHWKVPSLKLLKADKAKPIDKRLVEDGARVLESTMRDFDVEATVVGMTVGPTVTRYEMELAPGVKVNRVTNLSKDIAYAMASPDVRILAPIPGKSAIGIEVPNRQRQLVALGDLLASPEAKEMRHPLEVVIGRDISGKPLRANLAEMPHLLIAGATGAGKSSCINSILTGVLMRNTPDQLRLILVDPKRVELGAYNDLPHLLSPVVTDPKKAANALAWAVREMERRYEILAHHGFRDIVGYQTAYERGEVEGRRVVSSEDGEAVKEEPPERLPYVLVVVDELNDLMMVAARDVEASICRLAQMARAVGIHLVIATQRPSVDVITGVIKANIPSRLAFSVSSLADSRVILDASGAEKLIGQGDMLMLGPSSSRAQRVQGAWVEETETRKIASHWRRQVDEPDYVEGVAADENTAGGIGPQAAADGDDDDETLVREAMELIVRSQLGSTSMLQRKLRVGFARAGRIMDILEERGVVGPSVGSKARDVLMTEEELDEQLTAAPSDA